MLSIFLLMPTFQVLAQDKPAVQPDQTAELKSPAEVDNYLAGMSDEERRRLIALGYLDEDAEGSTNGDEPMHKAMCEGIRKGEPFDPDRTVLVDDSLAVLRSAHRYGIGRVVAIRRPDTTRPPRDVEDFHAVDALPGQVPLGAQPLHHEPEQVIGYPGGLQAARITRGSDANQAVQVEIEFTLEAPGTLRTPSPPFVTISNASGHWLRTVAKTKHTVRWGGAGDVRFRIVKREPLPERLAGCERLPTHVEDHAGAAAAVISRTELRSRVIPIHREDIVAIDLKMHCPRAGPDQRSHPPIANRLTLDGTLYRSLVNKVRLRDERIVVHVKQICRDRLGTIAAAALQLMGLGDR